MLLSLWSLARAKVTGASIIMGYLTRIASIGLGLVGLVACSASGGAQESLSVIDGPSGGKVVYGSVNEGLPQAAMAAVLRYVHTQFGEAPVVGKVFQSQDGQNFGAFFTVSAKNQGDTKFAGLVIVSIAQGVKPAAAVLYDESTRFAQTEPILLRTLTDAWRKAATATPAPAAS